MSFLEVRHVQKIYTTRFGGTKVQALTDVNFTVEKGEYVAIMGESGSGKTTFGKLVAGLEKPSEGTISFLGKEVQNLKERDFRPFRRELQMIFQSSNGVFDPTYTIGESIREVMQNYMPMSPAEYEDAIDEILEKVGLEPAMKHRYVSQLSGGQCQRANIARALVLRPKLVICDEPVSSLDFSIRKQILNLLNDMQEEFGLTYLLITHDLSNVPYVCKAVAIMYQGKVVEYIDRTDCIWQLALHPYTKLLFQSIPATDPRKRKIGMNDYTDLHISETAAAKGCCYQNRCSLCTKKCKKEKPELVLAGDGHWVACHHFENMK